MSASLARRAGTVGALVAAAGVILVAGAWPALAAVPPAGAPIGAQAERAPEKRTAPEQRASGQDKSSGKGTDGGRDAQSPAPEPAPAETTAPASGQGQGKAQGGTSQGNTSKSGTSKGGTSQGDGPSQGQGAPADRGPQAEPAAPPAAGPGSPVARPRAVRPAPFVGPVAPVAVPVAVSAPVMGPHVPSALASTGVRAGRPQVAAADASPLRPTGAEPIALPAVVRKPQPVPTDLGRALPIVAAKTAAAVAGTPEWPLGIVGICLVFLLVQNRIDRRDPKLAYARLEDDAPLEFAPLDGRPHLRLVTAA